MREHHRRLSALEQKSTAGLGRAVRFLMWLPRQTWADVVRGIDAIRPGDRVGIVRYRLVDHSGPVNDPEYDRDAPIAAAWLAERGAAHV